LFESGRTERVAIRAAARLVHAELDRIAGELQVAIDDLTLLPFVEALRSDAWDELRPVLARVADSAAWEATLAAYAHAALLWARWDDLPSEQARGTFNEQGVADLRATIESVRYARGEVRKGSHAELSRSATSERIRRLPEE
jgi:hypothetical protein